MAGVVEPAVVGVVAGGGAAWGDFPGGWDMVSFVAVTFAVADMRWFFGVGRKGGGGFGGGGGGGGGWGFCFRAGGFGLGKKGEGEFFFSVKERQGGGGGGRAFFFFLKTGKANA